MQSSSFNPNSQKHFYETTILSSDSFKENQDLNYQFDPLTVQDRKLHPLPLTTTKLVEAVDSVAYECFTEDMIWVPELALPIDPSSSKYYYDTTLLFPDSFQEISESQCDPLPVQEGEPYPLPLTAAELGEAVDSVAHECFSEDMIWAPELAPPIDTYQIQPLENPRIFICSDIEPSTNVLDLLSPCLVEKLQKMNLENVKNSIYLRDSSVTLFNRSRLIPHPIKIRSYSKLLGMLPSHAKHFLLTRKGNCSSKALCGRGFEEHNVIQAKRLASDYGMKSKLGKTSLEGGNCFIFLSNGQRKAIIGENSLYISMLALEEQNAFAGIQPKKPSVASLRIARNLAIYQKIKFLKNRLLKSKQMSYRKQLLAPLTPEEKIRFYGKAAILEAKRQATIAKIAEEVDVPIKDVIFPPQIDFHIDLNMTVTPLGTVILHDPQTTLKFLDALAKETTLSEEESALMQSYVNQAHLEIANYQNIINITKKLLRDADIDFVLMPAAMRAKREKSALNYCNGIFVKMIQAEEESSSSNPPNRRYFYFTTGPSLEAEAPFHDKFTDLFHANFPNYNLFGIPDMSSFIAETSGGLHCLTTEEELISDSSDP